MTQAKSHILNACEVLEQLTIEPDEHHLIEYLVGFNVHLLSLKCSFHCPETSSQRTMKTKTKPLTKKKSMEDDIRLIEGYLENLKPLMSTEDYDPKQMEFLTIQFEMIVTDFEEFNGKIFDILQAMLAIIDKYPADDSVTRIIDLYLRYGTYLVQFDDHTNEGFNYFKKAVELAEKEEERDPSDMHRRQLANASFQWGKARVRANRLSGNYEINEISTE